MIKNSKGIGFPQGEEENHDPGETGKSVSKTTKASSSMIGTVNSSPWLRLKDPRIVRVSRVFGGKDRHSKVCTIRGLRDRRVRLSVPTALQLYDLQDRLGLNQPSKVVDWLLNAAKEEIDELPPLPMPMPGTFPLLPSACATELAGEASPSNQNQGVLHKSDNTTSMEWESGNSSSGRLAAGSSSSFCSPSQNASSDAADPWNSRSKEVMLVRDQADDNGKETLRGARNNVNELVFTDQREERNDNTIYQRSNMNHPFFPGMINNIAYNTSNTYRWEPPSYPLLMSHLGGGNGGGLPDHNNLHGLNVMSLQPSALSLSTGSPFQLGPGQAQFSNIPRGAGESHEPRQAVSNFHMLSSNPMRSLFHFGASNSTSDNIGSLNEQSKDRE